MKPLNKEEVKWWHQPVCPTQQVWELFDMFTPRTVFGLARESEAHTGWWVPGSHRQNAMSNIDLEARIGVFFSDLGVPHRYL